METEISLPKVMLDVEEPTNRIRQVRSEKWRQRLEMMWREIFEGHEEFLGVTPD